MPRKGDVRFIPTAGTGGKALLPLDSIPDEIKKEVEEIYETLQTHDGRMFVDFDTVAELEEYVLQVTSYCTNRMVDGKPAPIRFRKSPAKGQPKTAMQYRITDLAEPNGTEEIREAVEAVKEAAVPPPGQPMPKRGSAKR